MCVYILCIHTQSTILYAARRGECLLDSKKLARSTHTPYSVRADFPGTNLTLSPPYKVALVFRSCASPSKASCNWLHVRIAVFFSLLPGERESPGSQPIPPSDNFAGALRLKFSSPLSTTQSPINNKQLLAIPHENLIYLKPHYTHPLGIHPIYYSQRKAPPFFFIPFPLFTFIYVYISKQDLSLCTNLAFALLSGSPGSMCGWRKYRQRQIPQHYLLRRIPPFSLNFIHRARVYIYNYYHS